MKRRINYSEKARRQRRSLFMFLMIGVVLSVYFSIGAIADDPQGGTVVTVQPGDTMWEICEENLPDNEDLRSYVYKVKHVNDMKTMELTVGQEIFLPNS